MGVDRALARILPEARRRPEKVHAAMRYAVLNGGKRLRPILTITVADIFRAAEAPALLAACAIEMVHCSSLILDDLPCMDDARLRRGRLPCHLEFGESTAILAAFGLLNRAFQLLQEIERRGVGPRKVRALAEQLTSAIGSDGLIGGQAIDLESHAASVDFATLEYIHSHKTGALFIASAEFGAILGDAGRKDRAAIVQYARNLGLAFQVQDDLLDADGMTDASGAGRPKTTFVSFAGIEGMSRLSRDLIESSIVSLAPLGKRGAVLEAISRQTLDRRS
ncbi:MAG: polyprenyl synthetase family protein [Acidobacteria bacterium]|nr:polyprenyl synthetase family protein [Acidobacteriota bacterium]